jgi:hypothetical protein
VNIKVQKRRVQQIIFAVIIIFFSCILMTPGITEGKSETDKTTGTSKVIIRVKSKGDFIGTVTRVNMVSKTITVSNKGMAVTFDVINPILNGYKNLEQIKAGDKIAVSYTGDGIRITKSTGMRSIIRQEAAKPVSESAKPKYESAKTNKARPVRIKERTNSKQFRDVDNNNDGRITPAELSAVIPNLTIEDFKRYDRNGDGCLNEAEYNAIDKSAKHDTNR